MRIDTSKIWMVDISKLYLIKKDSLAKWLFIIGAGISYFATLRPWFLWSIGNIHMVLASIFMIASMSISVTLRKPLFNNNLFLIPTLACTVLFFYERLFHETNLSGYIGTFFNVFLFYSLYRVNPRIIQETTTVIAKVLASFLAVSLACFFLYLMGVPFPGYDLQFGEDFYSFTNHYLFMIDDRSLFSVFPRFQSVCLEPSHLGTACAVLLQCQRNKWKKWYNIVLLASTIFSFSLGAYAYLSVIVFLNLWINRKRIFAKVLILISLILTTIIGSFYYNNGENLLHDLIILRLEIDEGELSGNNRTSIDFDKEFESYLKSDDILKGRELKDDLGNSGYKVYIYRYGIIGLVLMLSFLMITLKGSKNSRAGISALTVALLIFGVDAFVTWFCRYLPLYATATQEADETTNAKQSNTR
ncbi:hypothetical protein [Hallella colorans]|uniref:hypothetical protein n=1 Tax=Hallella colorans TaxID=1703337 RepID=UPI00288B4110|nr:hypothetical protein [Hallella colorans]